MHVVVLLLASGAVAQSAGAGANPDTWQDRILSVPYSPPLSSQRPTLILLRQDFEELAVNTAILGRPMRIGGKDYAHGIGTHAVSHIRISSPEPIARFSASIGVDNNQVTNPGHAIGSVVFAVEADRREVYRSDVVWAGAEPIAIDVDTGGARIIDLHVTDGGNGPSCDWADWAELAITLQGGAVVPLHEMKVVLGGIEARYPFSFVCGGRVSDELLDGWRVDRKSERLDADRTMLTTTWTDPDTGLRVTWETIRYADCAALDWVLYFENTGSSDTPIIENVQPLNLTFNAGPFMLHRTKGSVVNPSDFEPSAVTLEGAHSVVLSSGPGKSSATDFPFFKIESGDGQTIVAIGWSGEWVASLECPDRKNLHATAGMELTHFVLHPGERVRTPRILAMHTPSTTEDGRQVDPCECNAQFRRLIYKHYAAKRNGETPLPIPFCNTCFTRGGGWLNECNAENQISLIRAYAKLGLEALLTDAGWFEGGWPMGAGNWTPRRDAYPNGIEPVALAAKEEGMIYGLWFEPERVIRGTTLHKEHPEWVLDNGNPDEQTLLANFGLREVQAYFFNIVKGFMAMPGFRVYRQDFNMFPLDWWRHNDAPDRQGITEMKYIEGLYAYWDRIAEAWPDSLREECASGGMRIDLETVKRMHIHQKTDYWFDDEADQAHLFGLSQYLPNNVVVAHLNRLDDYSFHSTMASSLCLGWIADAPDFDFERGKKLLSRYLEVRHLLVGDWYPLLPYTTKSTEWMASQYHRADLDEGMILVFRHPDSPYPTAEVSLHRLDGQATYELTYDSTGGTERARGADLMAGLRIDLPTKRSSDLIVYRRAK
jgi:alpha-galactosidase